MALRMDNVDKLFQDRFGGHEMPVDPALWAAIEGQLLVSAATSDPVNELFKERFQGHELPVDPAVWDGIGRQLGHTPAPSASTSAWTWAAGAAAVLAVGIGLWFSTVDRPAAASGPEPAPALVVAETTGDDVSGKVDLQPVDPAIESVSSTQALVLPVAKGGRAPGPVPDPIPAEGQEDLVSPPVEAARASAATDEQPDAWSVEQPSVAGVMDEGKDAADPGRVEAIIREIAERTVNEARTDAREEALPPQLQQATGENTTEAPELFMPNTFTPNGDGVNDTYDLPMEGFERMSVKVLSLTTDKLVFSSMNGEPWTGAGCEDGMYVVVVEAVSEDGRNLSKAKVVWLTRERMN
jgi:hypothetical protein